MDLKRLRYFVTVAHFGSFTRAAEALRMAQPPLSQRIQELEAKVGSILINRDSRPLTLTPAGRLFFDHAMQVLQKTDAMMASMRRLSSEERRTLTLGVVPANFHGNIACVIREFRRALPEAGVRILEMNSIEQSDALRQGRIDAGISRIQIVAEGVQRIVLREEPMVVALPYDHPLANMEEAIPLEALRNEPFIVYTSDPRPSLADHVLAQFTERDIALSNVIEVRQYDTALILIAAGSGLSIVPASAHFTSTSVVHRPLLEHITSPIVFCHRDDDNSPELRVLYSVFSHMLGEHSHVAPVALEARLVSSPQSYSE
jgi:DNA-binding transcriptional LysR family regulator